MTRRATDLMQRIHGTDIYAGFVPTFPIDLQGWNSEDPAFGAIIVKWRPTVVIDVGVWKGASTIFLANLLQANEIDGVVIAIDTFLGSEEHWDRSSTLFDLIPRRHGVPLLYEQFLANVVRTHTQDRVVPLPLTTDAAAATLRRLRVAADLIHIDAAHDYESVLRDARTYWQLLQPGGFLVGDDYTDVWPSVVRAADDFAREVREPLACLTLKWIVRKPAAA